jgi:hypothetical protein
VKVFVNVWFWVNEDEEVNAPAVSLVTVWGVSVVFTHFTCVPALIERVAGEKEYFSSFSTIFTVTTLELACDVAVAVGAEVGCVVAVGEEDVVVPPPPQAAKRKATIIASGRNLQERRVRLVNDDRFICMMEPPLNFQRRLSYKYSTACVKRSRE